MKSGLPPSASVAEPGDGAKMHAPAAARNRTALCDLIIRHAPKTGRALEIASGTGQHVTGFAKAAPTLEWQPTEIDPTRLASIAAYVNDCGLDNIRAPLALNASVTGWSEAHKGLSLVVLVNLLHLISKQAAKSVITEAMATLRPQGVFILYGPFKRNGALTSEGDTRFDADLRAADPLIGYKDNAEILTWLTQAGATSITLEEMPANNLAIISTR